MVLDHIAYRQVFHHYPMIALRIGLGGFEMLITSLPIDLQMRLGSLAPAGVDEHHSQHVPVLQPPVSP